MSCLHDTKKSQLLNNPSNLSCITAVKYSSCSKYLVSVSKDGSIIVWVEGNQTENSCLLDEKSFYHKAASVSGTGKYFTDLCLFDVKLNEVGLIDIVVSAQDGSLSVYCLKDRSRGRAEKETHRRQVTEIELVRENLILEFIYSTATSVGDDNEL